MSRAEKSIRSQRQPGYYSVMARRRIVRLELSRAAKTELDKLCDHHGSFQSALSARIIEWFVVQHPTIQAEVLGFYPSSPDADLAPLLLRALEHAS